MIKLKNLNASPQAILKNTGWNWMLGENTLPYITNEMVVITEDEANAYHAAAEELYEMFIEAAEHVIENKLYAQLGIPENLIEAIETSWENDSYWHLYGRFDFAGGTAGKPIKLIEFNADTATCIPETAIVQWAMMKANGLDEDKQFNTLYESLVEMFETILAENPTFETAILFAAMDGYPEDETNVDVLMRAAEDAGFDTDFAYIEEVEFSPDTGIFKYNEDGTFTKFDFFFKLVPWEYIGWDEPELASILTQIIKQNKAIVINPAYTLLYQSKGILKILWDLFPNHPLLLETSNKPLVGKAMVEKVLFGREGANVTIIDASGKTIETKDGEYHQQPAVYQEYTELLTDAQSNTYQAGVFVAAEPCGLGFRRGGKIIDNKAQFCGHMVE